MVVDGPTDAKLADEDLEQNVVEDHSLRVLFHEINAGDGEAHDEGLFIPCPER